jgi:hypothetical protein
MQRSLNAREARQFVEALEEVGLTVELVEQVANDSRIAGKVIELLYAIRNKPSLRFYAAPYSDKSDEPQPVGISDNV